MGSVGVSDRGNASVLAHCRMMMMLAVFRRCVFFPAEPWVPVSFRFAISFWSSVSMLVVEVEEVVVVVLKLSYFLW